MFYHFRELCQLQVPCGQFNGVTHCADYFWLEGYSLYKGDPWNEWEAIGSQISPKQALDYAAGSWTCSRQNGQGYCVKLNIHPPGNGYGVDAALTDDATISTAREATQVALGVQNNYGFSSPRAALRRKISFWPRAQRVSRAFPMMRRALFG